MNYQEDIKKALDVLEKGGVILYPTDTIWGIGCDATNAEAVKRVYDIKKRVDSKSMLVLVDTSARIERYVQEVPEVAWDLVELSVKPLTVIFPGAKFLAENLVADDGSIGIRVTQEAFSKALCARFKRPIVSTSANESGALSPRNFDEISQNIRSAVDYVVQYRQEEKANPSPSGIIKIGLGGEFQIIRE